MLINTVLFAVGSNLEKLVCEAVVHDPNYVVVKKVLTASTLLGSETLSMILSVSYGWESIVWAPRACVGCH